MKYLKKLKKENRIKIILCLLLILCTIFIASAFSVLLSILQKSPETNFISLKDSFAQTSTIYDQKNKVVEDIETRESRVLVDLDTIPKHVQEAFISIEDRKFYNHKGLDIRSIMSSLKSNLSAGHIVRGGSTISQQLIKNTYLNNEKSLTRKLQEAYLTMQMENELEKDEILEAYLNRIDLGFGSYGIQIAARNYFSKDVSQLTLAESALLAGIVKSPAKYQPIHRIPIDEVTLDDPNILGTMTISGIEMALVKNDQAFDRQEIVLNTMVDSGYISTKERQDALKENIKFSPYTPAESPYSSYVSDYINDEAAREIMKVYKIPLSEAKEKVATGGLKIYSTLDSRLQLELEDLYRNFPKKVLSKAKNQGANFLNFQTDESNNILDNKNKILFFHHSNLFTKDFDLNINKAYFKVTSKKDIEIALDFFQINNNGIQIKDTYIINDDGNLLTYDMGPLTLNPDEYKIERDHILIPRKTIEKYDPLISISDDTLKLSSQLIDYPHTPTLQPQSNSIILDNKTGSILAFVGGLEVDNSNKRLLNRLYSQRQPGTALIPFSVYLPALVSGETLGSIYDDVPQMTDNQIWPLDPEKNYQGFMTIKEALALQKSSISVHLLKGHGLESALESLKKFGFYKDNGNQDSIITPNENKERNDFTLDSLALGNLVRGTTTPQLAQAYACIASNGQTGKTHIIDKIVDSNGKEIINNKTKPLNNITKENSYLLRHALFDTNFSKEIQSKSKIDSYALIGKNKFNSDYNVFGSTPSYTIGLWIGSDTPKLFLSHDPNKASGFYLSILNLLEDTSQFSNKPSNIIDVEISNKTGLLANSASRRHGSVETMPYIKGTEPKVETKNYTRKLVCSVSNMLANKYCPDTNVVARYYFVRPDGYEPKDFGGIYPSDFYSVPSRYCKVHTKDWYLNLLEKQNEEDDDDENNNNENNMNDNNSE